MQRNWFEFGILLTQCALLAIVAWYGSKILRFLRAFFEYQNEIRQRLTSIGEVSGHGGEIGEVWRDVKSWLQAPMGSGGVDPVRRILKWLQAR